MTQKGDHKLIDTVYAAKSLKEAVDRIVTADEGAAILMVMLKERGRIIYNSVQSVIIIH